MIRVACAALAIVAGSPARAAWALCPNCLAQRPVLTPTLELIGIFLLVPFAVAAIATWVVRRALYRRSAALPSGASAPPSSDGGDQGG